MVCQSCTYKNARYMRDGSTRATCKMCSLPLSTQTTPNSLPNSLPKPLPKTLPKTLAKPAVQEYSSGEDTDDLLSPGYVHSLRKGATTKPVANTKPAESDDDSIEVIEPVTKEVPQKRIFYDSDRDSDRDDDDLFENMTGTTTTITTTTTAATTAATPPRPRRRTIFPLPAPPPQATLHPDLRPSFLLALQNHAASLSWHNHDRAKLDHVLKKITYLALSPHPIRSPEEHLFAKGSTVTSSAASSSSNKIDRELKSNFKAMLESGGYIDPKRPPPIIPDLNSLPRKYITVTEATLVALLSLPPPPLRPSRVSPI